MPWPQPQCRHIWIFIFLNKKKERWCEWQWRRGVWTDCFFSSIHSFIRLFFHCWAISAKINGRGYLFFFKFSFWIIFFCFRFVPWPHHPPYPVHFFCGGFISEWFLTKKGYLSVLFVFLSEIGFNPEIFKYYNSFDLYIENVKKIKFSWVHFLCINA